MSVSLRKTLTQCEGCYVPLGPLLDAGYETSDFDITWTVCATHKEEVDRYYGYDVPFDQFDDYHNGYYGGGQVF